MTRLYIKGKELIMSFGNWARSPEEVQRDNGGRYDFDKIAQKYEDTAPINSRKRRHLNIRPNGERSRCWERIVKVSDNEYYLTNNAYRWYDMNPDDKYRRPHSRAITFKKQDGLETIILHTTRKMWGDNPGTELYPRDLSTPSNFYFYHHNLPTGIDMVKHYTKTYVALQVEGEPSDWTSHKAYYTLDKGDIHLTRNVGEKLFKPLIVHREVHRSLDRKKTKALREELKPFIDYVRVMLPLAPKNSKGWYGTTPLNLYDVTPNQWDEGLKRFCCGKSWRELVGAKDEVPEYWFELVQYYKAKCNRQTYNFEARAYEDIEASPQAVMNYIAREVYKQEKPFHEELVELGKKTFDSYRNW